VRVEQLAFTFTPLSLKPGVDTESSYDANPSYELTIFHRWTGKRLLEMPDVAAEPKDVEKKQNCLE
jgi:hypothetical protein